ncbi:hypothetical protein JKP88DRAFT_271319 [Tribonema minus]|uniref:Uncharacterized protein n=1 Tax=Tribonema minus TaxID=303371 RepID=A0A835ZMI0_9STRA|nr:hypothetical protein JKP88DRAFT_271319 [Tribonema minus]
MPTARLAVACISALVPVISALSYSLPISGDWLELSPVGLGRYNGEPAAFLSRSQSLVSPRTELLPLPIDSKACDMLSQAMGQAPLAKLALAAAAQSLLNRDGGLYDNLPWEWGAPLAKRAAFARVSSGRAPPPTPDDCASAYDLLARCLRADCNAVLKTIVIEEDDSREGGLSLAGALAVERLPQMVTLLGETFPRPFSGGELAVVECAADEAVGVALAQGRALCIERSLFEAASLPANFIMEDGRMRLNIDLRGQRAMPPPPPPAPAPADIKSAARYFKLDSAAKRAVLRGAGVRPPRRRMASAARLDELLLPLLDETVRRDVMLRRALAREDYAAAAQLGGAGSERAVVKHALADAVEEEDYEAANRLRARLEVLTALRADVTQDEGSYDRYLDADEWYVRERMRAMGRKDV